LLKSDYIDVEKIISDFPILSRKINGHRLVYLDNAATSQKPVQVIDAVSEFYLRHNANVHRSVHRLGEEATELYEGAREKVASFINGEKEEIIFTRGTTESINLVRFSWAEKFIQKGDNIVLTLMEHHSNIVPWQLVAKKKGANLKYVGIDSNGRLQLDKLEDYIQGAKLLAITQCSNVLGTVNDVEKACFLARKNGAISVVDAAQSVPHMKVDVKKIGCDFLAFSGHKMLAPNGIGVLYGRKKILEEMDPFHGGGDMIKQVFLDHATWNDVPYKFEAGTVNTGGAIGLAEAIKYIEKIGIEKIEKHEKSIASYCMEKLSSINNLKIYGPEEIDERIGLVSFNVGDIHPHDVATILDKNGIAIRSGHHCAQPLMNHYSVPAMCRASFYIYNTYEDVDRLYSGIKKVLEVFG
jgi:cysteine desulfurase/selenocysteine lyase